MNQELETLLKNVCEPLGVTVAAVRSKSRHAYLCDARRIFIARANRIAPCGKIASAINRHRTVCYYFLDTYLDYLQYDSLFLKKVKSVDKYLLQVNN